MNKYYIVPYCDKNNLNEIIIKRIIEKIGCYRTSLTSNEKPLKRGIKFIVEKCKGLLSVTEVKSIYRYCHVSFSLTNHNVRVFYNRGYNKSKKVTKNFEQIVQIIIDELNLNVYDELKQELRSLIIPPTYINGLFYNSYNGLEEIINVPKLRELINKDINLNDLLILYHNLGNMEQNI